MNKKRILIVLAVIVALALLYSYFNKSTEEDVAIITQVKKGTFVNEVITSGELQSSSLKKINGPSNLRKFKLRDIKIQDLIPEGTFVKKGDYVGRLDPSGVNEQIIDAQLNLENAESKYTQQKLDTTLSLKQERTNIADMLFSIAENKLELKQSIYEPPATIKKLENSVEKLERNIREKRENYAIKKRQAKAKMVEVGTEVSKIRKKLEALVKLRETFVIHSESEGMLTYVKSWNGSKKKVGSSISPWDPAIASLPDLSKMESKTYANEVDIRQIKKGLPVTVGFDAFPDVELAGVVEDVANVGEQKRGSDIKVFQVLVKLNEVNDNIKPGMTTSNRILTKKIDSVLMIPLEAVFSKDSISFAYVKKGYSIYKKQIVLGESNNNVVIVKKGLTENEKLYLNEPEGLEEKSIELLKK